MLAVEDGDPGYPCFGQEVLHVANGGPRPFASGARYLLDDLVHRNIVADRALVHVDDEDRGPFAELGMGPGLGLFSVGQHPLVVLGQEVVPNRHVVTSIAAL